MPLYFDLPIVYISAVFIFGLLIGSFLNVVAYRLPLMLQAAWQAECKSYLEISEQAIEPKPFNLFFPGSQCPHCSHRIRFWENIPILSYLWLRGKCSACKNKISFQYPFVEFLCGIFSVAVIWQFGISVQTVSGLFFTWAMLALSVIDIKQQLLPDIITIPMIWLGLFINVFAVYCNLQDAVIGALAGYLSLWLLAKIFFLVSGKIGMGHGDFKLLALLGAWFGWQMLPLIVLISSLLGSIIGVTLIVFKNRDRQIPIPFGPYLALAGWCTMMWGKSWMFSYLNFLK